MATIPPVNGSTIALAQAERQVQRAQSQVQQDSARLNQSQTQLVREQRQLDSVHEQNRAAQINTAGQALGQIIDTVA